MAICPARGGASSVARGASHRRQLNPSNPYTELRRSTLFLKSRAPRGLTRLHRGKQSSLVPMALVSTVASPAGSMNHESSSIGMGPIIATR